MPSLALGPSLARSKVLEVGLGHPELRRRHDVELAAPRLRLDDVRHGLQRGRGRRQLTDPSRGPRPAREHGKVLEAGVAGHGTLVLVQFAVSPDEDRRGQSHLAEHGLHHAVEVPVGVEHEIDDRLDQLLVLRAFRGALVVALHVFVAPLTAMRLGLAGQQRHIPDLGR